MASSVDPTIEIANIKARLDAMSHVVGTLEYELCYEGVDQGTKLVVDRFGNKAPYRDFEPGSTIPAAQGRMVAAGEQGQPHVWAFQVHHYASTRKLANDMANRTDVSLIGWEPSDNAGPITSFYFTVYDDTAKNGERVGWIATRFYETELGQNPDFSA